jgi:GT2 family glycosyltransferase
MIVEYVKHNSTRSKEFRTTTTIYKEDGIRYVKKEVFDNISLAHLKNMKESYSLLENSIISSDVKLAKIINESSMSLTFEFIDGISFEDKFYNSSDKKFVIDEYIKFIKNSFKTKELDGKTFFDGMANIDLILSNLIFKDEKIYIIDYEWVFNKPTEVNYVIFRGLSSLTGFDNFNDYFSEDEIDRFNKLEKEFLLDYALNQESFFQIQHNYLKDTIEPFKKIEELDAHIKYQDGIIEEKIRFISDRDEINEKQAEYIDSLTSQIRELEDIAQSLRIKSRIKRLLPKSIVKTIQKLKNPPVVKIETPTNIEIVKPQEYFEDFNIERYKIDISIDIIIPVYNGYEFLNPLFDSLERNTHSAHRLIVIDDCSPDDRVKPLLIERLKSHKNSIFLEHEVNLGFVKSVNEGYSYTKNHFVILNTDTEVPPLWLERVIYPILKMDNISSTTPFTNSGEIASFPNFIADNDIFEGMSVDRLDDSFKYVNASNFYAKAPTGVGFCMGVNYDLIQDIGFFIEKDFGKGYGEENDWCQRAIKSGYSNLIVPNLFVYHKHGGSFTAEQKRALIKENAKKLLKRYPNYDRDVQDYIKLNPHKTLRELLVVISSSKIDGGLHLVIDHGLGGGANDYTKKRLEGYLEEDKKVLELIYNYHQNIFNLRFRYKDYDFNFNIESIEDIDYLFKYIDIKDIFLNSTVSFKEPLVVLNWIKKLKESKNAKLTLPIHDFYMICPNYTLLNHKDKYCDIPDDLDECKACLKSNFDGKVFLDDSIDISKWRESWGEIISITDNILCFSNSSKEILLKAYRDIDKEKIEVIPHQPQHQLEPLLLDENRDIKTIGILGSINKAKGADTVKELVERIERDNLDINIVLIGEISSPIISPKFKVTGRYQRDRLTKLIEHHKIDIFLIPSIWPETFSYTTQEIMMMDMPLMVFNIGAPAERVKEYRKGVVLEDNYIDNLFKYILDKTH